MAAKLSHQRPVSISEGNGSALSEDVKHKAKKARVDGMLSVIDKNKVEAINAQISVMHQLEDIYVSRMGRYGYKLQLVNLVNQMPGMLVHHQQVELQVGNRFWCFGPLLGPLTLWLNYSSHHPFSKPRNARQMEYGVESWWMYFVWCLGNSFHGIRMPFRQDPKSSFEIFTLKIYTRLKNLN